MWPKNAGNFKSIWYLFSCRCFLHFVIAVSNNGVFDRKFFSCTNIMKTCWQVFISFYLGYMVINIECILNKRSCPRLLINLLSALQNGMLCNKTNKNPSYYPACIEEHSAHKLLPSHIMTVNLGAGYSKDFIRSWTVNERGSWNKLIGNLENDESFNGQTVKRCVCLPPLLTRYVSLTLPNMLLYIC